MLEAVFSNEIDHRAKRSDLRRQWYFWQHHCQPDRGDAVRGLRATN